METTFRRLSSLPQPIGRGVAKSGMTLFTGENAAYDLNLLRAKAPKIHRPIMSIKLKRRGFNKKIIRHLSHLSRAILRRNCEKSGSGGEHKANRCGHLICSVFKYIISRPASEGNKVTGTFEKLCLPRQLHGSPIVFAIGRIKAIAKDLGTCSKPGTSHIVCRPGTC